MNSNLLKVVVPIVLIFGFLGLLGNQERGKETYTAPPTAPRVDVPAPTRTSIAPPVTGNDQQVISAYNNRRSDVQVQGSAVVSRLLPDDNEGSRHQKFILRMSSGGTLLIAHNIDLAPRIPNLKVGDLVEFFGEYAWNQKGGVVHWTHHDPRGRHTGGWLQHKGRTYQ